MKVSMQEVIGKGYKEFWDFKGRYRVCKGSRASKKSKTTALNFIFRIMKHKEANLLVVRRFFGTLKDSCYTELKWAINRLGVESLFECRLSPLEIIYKPTGQKIYFRGLDDPIKITSITVDVGCLCWLWIEEAYEIESEENFNMLDESIRGATPSGLFKQITLTLNPWNERHWIKKRFFDEKSSDILAITTNYKCNEWLDEADLRVFEKMKKSNPRRYQVAGLGNWGITDGLVYENWSENMFSLEDVINLKGIESVFGLDFGYTNDPTALFCGLVDLKNKVIYVFDEIYEKGLSNEKIAKKIFEKGFAKEKIVCDCAEPKSIDRLKELGIRRACPARKGKDSLKNGIDFIQEFRVLIHPKCENFIREIGEYCWKKDKFGRCINEPIDEGNHLMDAMRYGLEGFVRGRNFSFE